MMMMMMIMIVVMVVVVTIYLLSCEIALERNSYNVCVQTLLETSFDQILKLPVPSFFSYFSDSVYFIVGEPISHYNTQDFTQKLILTPVTSIKRLPTLSYVLLKSKKIFKNSFPTYDKQTACHSQGCTSHCCC